jgi:hypothetical protein
MQDELRTVTDAPRPSARVARHPEFLWLYATVVVVVTQVVAHVSGALGWRPSIIRSLIGLSPWIILSSVFLVLYRGSAQRFADRFARVVNPWLTHITLVALVALGVGAALRAVHSAMGVSIAPAPAFLAECVMVSWIVVLPAHALEQARLRERRVIERLDAAERAAVDAQLRALQAQTNPHFLFNSLNVVAGLIHEDPALAERTLERFASLFRYSIEGSRATSVTLERELAFVEDYLEVQRLRFGERLATSIEADAAALKERVPPLFLQPIVENAVLHGRVDGGRSTVRVRVEREAEQLRVTVTDDGPGLGASAHRGTQTSLDTLRARLAAMPGASLSLRNRDEGGCEATVLLPCERP